MKKRRMKNFLMRSLAYWGISAVEVANTYNKRLSRRWLSFTRTDTSCYHLPNMELYFSTYFNRANPPHHPSVCNMKAVPHMEG